MASEELRRAWAELIDPADYDAHMAAIGQAEANANLIKSLIEEFPLKPDSRLLFAGAGTGQMFDYIEPAFLGAYEVTFSDIREEFLDELSTRLKAAGAIQHKVVIDDVKDSKVDKTDAVALVLVLEHVDWPTALSSLIRLGTRRFYLVLQINPPGMTSAVAPNRALPPSLANLPPEAKSELIDIDALTEFLTTRGFTVICRRDVSVADEKTMAGFVFDSKPLASIL